MEASSLRAPAPSRPVVVHSGLGTVESPASVGGTERRRAPVDSQSVWHVLRTRSRQEKALVATLAGVGYRTFLPLVRQVKYYGHRRRVVERPLFSSYLFLWGPIEAAYYAVGTKRVAGLIEVKDQARLEWELAQIRLALDGNAELSPYGYLKQGTRVRVTGGPFMGLEGLVDSDVRQDRLVLQVQALGQATSLEIDASLLERIG